MNQGPDKPFVHEDGCPIVRADPNVEIPWSYYGEDFGRPSACARPSTSVSRSVTIAFGSTRSTRRPAATSGSANTSTRPSHPSSGSC